MTVSKDVASASFDRWPDDTCQLPVVNSQPAVSFGQSSRWRSSRMKLVRVSHPAGPTYGIVTDDVIRLLDSSPFDPSESRETGETIPLADATLLAPVETPTIYAIGRNYADHAKEMGFELPSEPSVFMKPRASLLAHG